MKKCRIQKSRRGWTLIEVIVAATIASAIFGTAVEMLSLTMHSAERARDRVASTAAVARLAEQFRADIHAATSVSVAAAAGSQARWTVKLTDDDRIEYATHDDGLRRTEYRGDKVQARDTFALPKEANARLELQPKDNPTEASLLLRRNGDATVETAGYTLRIEARLGRDRRFNNAPAQEKAS